MADPRVSEQSSPQPSGERMQRLRVGITGLAAVLIVIAIATAIGGGMRRTAEEANVTTPPPVVATLPPAGNGTAPNTEPLAQLGAAPGSNPAPAGESHKK